MEQNATNSDIISVERRKFKRMVVPKPKWEFNAANTEFIEWKIKHNLMMKEMIRRKPKIVGRKKVMEDFVMTKKIFYF